MTDINNNELLQAVQGMFDNLESKLNTRIDNLDTKLSNRMDTLGSELLTLHGGVKAVKDDVDIIKIDVNDMKSNIKRMDEQMLENFVELKEMQTVVEIHSEKLKVIK